MAGFWHRMSLLLLRFLLLFDEFLGLLQSRRDEARGHRYDAEPEHEHDKGEELAARGDGIHVAVTHGGEGHH